MAEERQVEVIEKPFHFFRGKWRQAEFALVTGDTAVVFYDRGTKMRRMKASEVFSSERKLEDFKRKYHEGWIVTGPSWRNNESVVFAVRLEFARDYHRGCHFRFVPRASEGAARAHERWPADWVLGCEGEARFFTAERSALRYAVKIQRARVRELRNALKKPESALAELVARLDSLKKEAA